MAIAFIERFFAWLKSLEAGRFLVDRGWAMNFYLAPHDVRNDYAGEVRKEIETV